MKTIIIKGSVYEFKLILIFTIRKFSQAIYEGQFYVLYLVQNQIFILLAPKTWIYNNIWFQNIYSNSH